MSLIRVNVERDTQRHPEMPMFRHRTLKQCLMDLGCKLLDGDDLKAVMISKNDDGDMQITLSKVRTSRTRFGSDTSIICRDNWFKRTNGTRIPSNARA